MGGSRISASIYPFLKPIKTKGRIKYLLQTNSQLLLVFSVQKSMMGWGI